jgi:hypothetical protein
LKGRLIILSSAAKIAAHTLLIGAVEAALDKQQEM